MIGDNGGGDYWFVFRDASDLGVWFYECEAHAISRRYDSLDAYLAVQRAERDRDIREPLEFRRPGKPTPEPWFRIPTKEGRERLASRLGVSPVGPKRAGPAFYWEWTVEAPKNLKQYFRAYEDPTLTDDARYSLVEILAHNLENRRYGEWSNLTIAEFEQLSEWQAFAKILRANPRLHASTMYYWSSLDATATDSKCEIAIPMSRVWATVESSLASAPNSRRR